MNNDLRQQILVSLRAEGVGEADRAREALAMIDAEMRKVSKAFGEGTATGEEFRKTISGLGTQWSFFNGLLKASEEPIQAIDIGLHKLQMAAIKFGDDYQAAMEKAAAAAEALALKEAEEFAKAAVNHERFLERTAKAEEEAAAKQAAILAKEQAARDRADIAAIKGAQDRERAVAETSAKVNQFFADEATARERAAQRVIEAEVEIDRLSQRSAANAAERYIEQEAARTRNSKAAMLQAREEQHFLDLLQEGVVMQDSAEKALIKTTEAKKKGTEASNKFGYGVLHVSHALQDLQYGTGAVLNNIPLMVQAFGGGPGLAGVTMAAAVAMQVLSEHIDVDLKAALTGVSDPIRIFTGSLEGIQEKIREIEDRPVKVGADILELDAAKQKLKEMQTAQEALNAAREGKSIYEKEAGEQASSTLEAEGGRLAGVTKGITAQFVREGFESSLTLKEQQAIVASTQKDIADVERRIRQGGDLDTIAGLANRRDVLMGQYREAVDKAGLMRTNIRKEAELKTGSLLAGAKAGNQPEARTELVRRLREDGEEDLARAIEGATPEAMEQEAEQEAAFDRGVEGVKNKFHGMRAAEKAAQKAADKRRQEINRQAGPFETEFGKDDGPGGLGFAALLRVAKKQSEAEIAKALEPQIAARITGRVPADMVNEIAAKIVQSAVAKAQAEASSFSGNPDLQQSGADEALTIRRRAAEKKAETARKQGDRDTLSHQEMALAQGIFNEAGGQLSEQGAMAAAHRAMQSMQKGVDFQTATMEAMTHVMAQLSGMGDQIMADQMRIRDQLNGVNRQLQMQGAQQRRNRAQRPSVLPFFGG